MRDTNVRPFRDEDAAELDAWRENDPAVLLEVPHGYVGDHVETAVVERDGEKIISLTGAIATVLDPLIKNPKASRLDVMEGLFKAEAALSFLAAKTGAQDIYISVPEEQTAYRRILERVGYTRILEGCAVYKKMLLPPVVRPSGPHPQSSDVATPLELTEGVELPVEEPPPVEVPADDSEES